MLVPLTVGTKAVAMNNWPAAPAVTACVQNIPNTTRRWNNVRIICNPYQDDSAVMVTVPV